MGYDVYLIRIPTGEGFSEFRAQVDGLAQEGLASSLLMKHVVREWHSGREGADNLPESVEWFVNLQGIRGGNARKGNITPIHTTIFSELLKALGISSSESL